MKNFVINKKQQKVSFFKFVANLQIIFSKIDRCAGVETDIHQFKG